MQTEEQTSRWPLFVISLQDARRRREKVVAACAPHAITPIILDAIDGRQGLPAALEGNVDRGRARQHVGRTLSDAELACALSHQAIYRRIVDEELPGAIILEDDAILSPGFFEFIAGRGYLAADFVQMDHMDTRVWYGRRRRWSDDISLIPLAANASLATGYSLSARGARYMLHHTMPVGGLADWPCDMTGLGGLVTWPRLVDHPPFETSDSAIEKARRALVDGLEPPRGRALRFLSAAYWRRWWFKRRTRKIS
jgi:glycosyl transferase family 25